MNDVQIIRAALGVAWTAKQDTMSFLEALATDLPREFEITEEETLKRIFVAIQNIEIEVLQRYELGVLRTIALNTLKSLQEFFSPSSLGREIRLFKRDHARIDALIENLVVFDSIEKAGASLVQSKEQILAELESVLQRCDHSDGIDPKIKSLVRGNFELVRHALAHLDIEGRGGLRATTLTAVGVLTLELRDQSLTEDAKTFVGKATDILLKVAGVIEVSQNVAGLLTYSGGAAGLLPAP